jgi:hypothetical protein
MSRSHNAKLALTVAGHLMASIPCVAKSATANRSTPNAAHAVWAGSRFCASEAPSQSEVIAVIVEAHARARRFRRSNRDEHLEFQRLRHLEPSDHRAGAAEERVACGLDTGERPSAPAISAARAIQCSRKSATCLGGPIATNSRMRKDCSRSISRDGSRRKQSPARRRLALPAGAGRARPRSDRWVVGGRSEHEFARIEAVGPRSTRCEAIDRRLDPRFVAVKRADARREA